MLHYDLNYLLFKDLFGIQNHGNGNKSRRNKILLAYLKDKNIFKEAINSGDDQLLHIYSMTQLKTYVLDRLEQNENGCKYPVRLINRTFYSDIYSTDKENGVCTDGDTRAIRYVKHNSDGSEHTYKMKAGKFLKAIIQENRFGRLLPEQVIRWLEEEFSQEWQTYTHSLQPDVSLVISKEFYKIYNAASCPGDFGSCMVNKGLHSFYEDYVEAHAAYLKNDKGEITARAIIFDEVYDEQGNKYRFLERQYSKEGNDILKRTLVDACIKAGAIDIYKKVGADCHASTSIVDINGNDMSRKKFHIKCSAIWGDTLSYQDTFKWFDVNRGIAYNYDSCSYDTCLDITYGTVGGDEDDEPEDDEYYDDFHEYYCSETTEVHVHGRIYYCDVDNLGDFILWEDEEYHHKDDFDVCPICGERFLKDNGYKDEDDNDILYCSSTCLEKRKTQNSENNGTFKEAV